MSWVTVSHCRVRNKWSKYELRCVAKSPVVQWSSIFLTLWCFNTVPLVVVTPNITLFCCCFITAVLLLLWIVMWTSDMQGIWYSSPAGVMTHRVRTTAVVHPDPHADERELKLLFWGSEFCSGFLLSIDEVAFWHSRREKLPWCSAALWLHIPA